METPPAEATGAPKEKIDVTYWNEWSNVKQKIEQKDYSSIFEFLKVIRYKNKKEKKYEAWSKDNAARPNKEQEEKLQEMLAKDPADFLSRLPE